MPAVARRKRPQPERIISMVEGRPGRQVDL
jgi:hypothetical protein